MAQPRPDIQAIGARLREERRRLGLTQAQVAAAAEISAPTQVGYERGYRTPDIAYETAIEKLGIDSRYVRTGIRERRHLEMLAWEHITRNFEIIERMRREGELGLDPREIIETIRLASQASADDPESTEDVVTRVLQLVTSQKP